MPNLRTELRPALPRIGERIAQLVVALPSNLDSALVSAAAQREIRSADVPSASVLAIAGAIGELARQSTPTD